MKKIGIGLLVFLLLIVGALFILPSVFKDDIAALVKSAANDNLNATLDFGNHDISIFTDFPNLTVTLHNVVVHNAAPFDGVTLADIGGLEVTVDLFSLMGDQMQLVSFGLVDATLDVRVLEDGTANWDIAKASEEEEIEEEPAADDAGFAMAIQRYYMHNVNLRYDDREGDMLAELTNLNHDGSGDFTADQTNLHTETTIEALTYVMEGIPYLNQVDASADVDMSLDLANSKYTFSENEFRINALVMGMDGWVAMPTDAIDMDLKFFAKETEFKSILSLVPAVYATDFDGIETAGTVKLDGFAKGISDDDNIPGFALNLVVEDAMFHYPDMPKSAENIAIDLHVTNPGGDADLTVTDLKRFHTDLADNPIELSALVKTPISDPDIFANIQANLDLASLKDVMPLEEGESYSGTVTANVQLDGKQSAIDREDYQAFKAAGDLILLDFDYKSPDLPYATNIHSMYLNFAPQFVKLTSFDANIGKSDIKATGEILNLLGWYYGEAPLEGRFAMTSDLMDLDEFMEEEEVAEGGEAAEEEPLEVIEIPADIDFNMTADITKMLYDGMVMESVYGGMHIHDQAIDMHELSMDMLQGTMIMDGTYETKNPATPYYDFGLNINKFDVQETFHTFNTMQQLVPAAEHATGAFSTQTTIAGVLDKHMEPIMETMNGKGKLRTHGVRVESKGALAKIGQELKLKSMEALTMEDANLTFEIKDGRVYVDPFDAKMGNLASVFAGSHGFDQTLDYVMKLELPMGALGGATKNLVNGLVDKANAGGAKFSVGDNVDLDVFIGGTVTDPIIRPGFKGSGGNLVDDAKAVAKEKITETVTEVKEEATEKANEEIEKQVKAIMDAAEKQASVIRAQGKTAAEKSRKEGYAAADQLIKEAGGNPLKKIAAEKAAKKLRSETDKKADKIEQEANTRADEVLKKAQDRADKLRV